MSQQKKCFNHIVGGRVRCSCFSLVCYASGYNENGDALSFLRQMLYGASSNVILADRESKDW